MKSSKFIKALFFGLLLMLTPEIWAQEKSESSSEKKGVSEGQISYGQVDTTGFQKKEIAPPWNAIDLTSEDAKLAGGYLPKTNSRIIIPIAAVVAAGIVTLIVVNNTNNNYGDGNNNNNDDDSDQTPLIINPDEYSVACGESVTLDVLANDQGDGLEITGAQANGAVVEIVDNILFVSEITQDVIEINYDVQDLHGNTGSGTASLTVEFPEIIAIDDNYEAESNANLNGNVLDNDTGQELSVIDYTQPEAGMISIEANGDFLYEPQADFGGNVQLTYTIQDARLKVADAIVMINVTPICDFELNIETTNASCGFADGQITTEVMPPGDYSYQWSDGTTEQNLSNASTGDYELTITDNTLNCSLSFDVTLGENPASYISDLQTNPAICPQAGEIIFEAIAPDAGPLDIHVEFGADIYDINVPTGMVLLGDYIPIEPGLYSITVSATNAVGDCNEMFDAQIGSQASIIVEITDIFNPSSVDADDGAIFGTVIAPNPPPFELFVNGLPTILENVNFAIEDLGIGTYNIYALSPSDGCMSDTVSVTLVFLASLIPRIAIIAEINSPPNYNIHELPGVMSNSSSQAFALWLEIPTGQQWYHPIVGFGYRSTSFFGDSDLPEWELNAQLDKTLSLKNIQFSIRGGPFALIKQEDHFDENNFGLLLQPLVQYKVFEGIAQLPVTILFRAGGRVHATTSGIYSGFFAGVVFEYSFK